jgi:hypothetical protein
VSRSYLVRQSLAARPQAEKDRPDVWFMTVTLIAAAFGVARTLRS